MHWEILDRTRQEILKQIAAPATAAGFYMAGGTALSLQMGLRRSVDFDFFTPQQFNTDNFLSKMRSLYPELKVLQQHDGTLDLSVNHVQISFFHYPYNMVKKLVTDADLPSLRMASPEDIAAMKLSAIGGRGAKKDFYDLYQICSRMTITPRGMCDILTKKFGSNRDFTYMILALSYFDDAEPESLPQVFKPANWDDIKQFFISFSSGMEKELMEH